MSKKLPLAKYAAWSPSKATLAGTCPRAFNYRYVENKPAPARGSAAKVGVTVHRALELALMGASVNTALDKAIEENVEDLTHAEVEKVRTFAQNTTEFLRRVARFKENNSVKNEYFEIPWAITQEFSPCEFGHAEGIVRGIVDMALVLDSGYVIIIDHKTGRSRPADYYSTQLNFYTVMALAAFPDLKGVQCALHYVAHARLEWGNVIKPQYIREVLQPWLIGFLNKKADRADSAVATPGKHCNWCDYRDICEFRGMNVEAGEGGEAS